MSYKNMTALFFSFMRYWHSLLVVPVLQYCLKLFKHILRNRTDRTFIIIAFLCDIALVNITADGTAVAYAHSWLLNRILCRNILLKHGFIAGWILL